MLFFIRYLCTLMGAAVSFLVATLARPPPHLASHHISMDRSLKLIHMHPVLKINMHRGSPIPKDPLHIHMDRSLHKYLHIQMSLEAPELLTQTLIIIMSIQSKIVQFMMWL